MTRLERLRRSLRASERKLRPLSCQAVAPYPHWIGGSDEGFSWCRPCAEKEIRRLRRVNPSCDYFLDGGYDAQTSDTCCHCEGCGCLLDYTLTEHGVDRELEHFTGHKPRKVCPDAAFHVARMLEGAEYHPDRAVMAAAAKIGREIASAMLQPQGGGA